MCEYTGNSVKWPNVVGDSHMPNPNTTYTSPHLRATHCVTTNCVGSAKSKVVPNESKGNSVTGPNVVGDSHVSEYHNIIILDTSDSNITDDNDNNGASPDEHDCCDNDTRRT